MLARAIYTIVLLGLVACTASTPPAPPPSPAPTVEWGTSGNGGYLAGAPAQSGSMRINVDVEDVDLADAMEQIGRQVGRNILVDPNVDERVTVSLRDIPWRDAVDVIARMTGCTVEERPGGILLLTQPPTITTGHGSDGND